MDQVCLVKNIMNIFTDYFNQLKNINVNILKFKTKIFNTIDRLIHYITTLTLSFVQNLVKPLIRC